MSCDSNQFKMFQVYESNTDHVINSLNGLHFLDSLKKKWDELHQETDVFRYRIDTIQERIVSDQYLIQLNINRGTKRRMPENISHISQPFDDDKFNFTKISDKEIMFTLTKDSDDTNKHVILVNVSPINRYHSLICPSVYKRLPQVATLDSLKLTLELMLYFEDRSLKIGFNSLCALASVNHLHYHLLIEHRKLPVELAVCKHLNGPLYTLEDYIVPTFCFYVNQDIDKATQDVYKLVSYLLQKCIAHNILITWGKGNDCEQDSIRVFVWPRKSCAGVKNLAAFNVAVCELAGWFPVYDTLEFENIQRVDLEKEIRKWKFEPFSELCDEVTSLF